MPRRARLALGGIPWHVIQRGNNRSVCFFSESDYIRYLDTLRILSEQFHCRVHAYVLMTNHVHLLVTPETHDGVSLLMKHLGQRYVQYINRTYRRSGTLWEGRFKSTLVQSSRYVLACYRYIELNPVRAGMVKHPHEYPWSSFACNAIGIFNPLVIPHTEYQSLGSTKPIRQKQYRQLFENDINPNLVDQIRVCTQSNYVLGNDRFRKQISEALGRRVSPGKSEKQNNLLSFVWINS